MKPKQHGGPRKGAGMKAKDGAKGLKRYGSYLDDETVTKARKIGSGMSHGLRVAVRAYKG